MIPILSSKAFGGQLSTPRSTGISPIFRGKIKVDDVSLRCYIKPLPDQIIAPGGRVVDNREVLSEALGFTLAKNAGLATPDNAGIIMLESEQIPDQVLAQLRSITPGNVPQKDYLAWFSQDMLHPSLLKNHIPDAPDSMRHAALARLALSLSKNTSTATIVTFDEWSENSDRNLGNLLGTADGGMILIDHGRLFRYPSWDPSALVASPLGIQNVIRDLVDSFVPHWSEKTPTKSARLLAYNNLAVTWRSKGETAAKDVLAEFLDDTEISQVLDFLSGRLDQTHYNSAVGLLV